MPGISLRSGRGWTVSVGGRPAGSTAVDLVERDAGGDAGVERLGRGRHRDPDQDVAGLAHQPRQPLALAADDQHERAPVRERRGRRCRHCRRRRGRRPSDPSRLVRLQLRGSGSWPARPAPAPRHRPRSSTRSRSSRPRVAPGTTTPCTPNAAGRAHDGAEVARVGHRVERDDQGSLGRVGARAVTRSCGVGILVRRHLQREPLVDGAVGHLVELVPGDLEHRRGRARPPA